MLARSNLTYAVLCNILGSREGAVGTACPNFGVVWTVPPNRQLEHKSFYFLYFRFVFIGEKDKGKISGLKPMRKLDLGVP